MSILFAGTALADFNIFGQPGTTTTAAQIAPYVSEGVALAVYDEDDYISASFAASGEVWISCYVGSMFSNSGSNRPGITIGTDDTDLFSLVGANTVVSNAPFKLRAWTGSAWADLNTGALFTSGLVRMDIHVKLHDTDGLIAFYASGNLVMYYAGDTIQAGLSTVSKVTFRTSYTNTTNGWVSAVIIATEDTRDMVFDQNQFAANGTGTDWTGDYTNVTKTGKDDAGFVKSATGGQVETYNQADIDGGLALLDVKAVAVPLRCRKGATGPSNIQAVARVGGTNYPTANLSPDVAWALREGIFETNPATGLPWTVAEVNAAEFGVKSIT